MKCSVTTSPGFSSGKGTRHLGPNHSMVVSAEAPRGDPAGDQGPGGPLGPAGGDLKGVERRRCSLRIKTGIPSRQQKQLALTSKLLHLLL